MEKFYKDIRGQAMRIVNYEIKEVIPLTDEKNKFYEEQKVCNICKKGFSNDDNDKKHHKVRDHCHYTGKFREAAHSICNLRYKTPKEIPTVFHNGSTYDYHFIINNLAKEFDGQLECLGENKEKYITFSVPISKELDNGKTITYKLKFIGSFTFMSTSLSSLVDNLSEQLHSDKCRDCKYELNYISFEYNQLIFQCFKCKRNYMKGFNIELIKRFTNTYEFCNGDINKFVLLLRKGIDSYEYMDSWERFNETSLPDKKTFLNELNLEDIDKDYAHPQKVFEEFDIKSLGDYHDFYVQSDTLLLADVFENFRNKCIEIYELDPAHFLSAPGLAWQACLKKTKVELELLTDIDMLLMVEKGTRGGICQAIHRYAKANNKYMKNYDRKTISSYVMYLDANNLYGWAMSQKLHVNGFEWVEDLSQFNEDFIKN